MGSLKLRKLEELVPRLYEAALNPQLWRSVLHEVSDILGADSAALFGAPLAPDRGIYFSPGADAAFSWLAHEGVDLHNPRPERAMRLRSARPVLTESDLFTEWELKHLPFNAALTKLGMRWEAGGVFAEIDGAPLFFTTQRRAGDERFGKAELDGIATLFPHLERAAHIASRLRTAEAIGMLDAFERTTCAAILLDARCCVVRMNPSAENLIGSDLYLRGGRLGSSHDESDRALQSLIDDVSEGAGLIRSRAPVTASLRRHCGRPLAVHGIPLIGQANDIFQRARAMLVIVDPDARTHAPSLILAQSYNLTPAEIRLAWTLADGMDLREAAVAHGVAISTVRNQLKAILTKTETGRQAELVGLLTRLARLSGQSD